MSDKPEEQSSEKPDAKVSRLSWWLAGGKPVKPDAKCLQVDKLKKWRRRSDHTDDGETRPFWQEAGYVLSDGKRMSGRKTLAKRTPSKSDDKSPDASKQSSTDEQPEEDVEATMEQEDNAETNAESGDNADDSEESTDKTEPAEDAKQQAT